MTIFHKSVTAVAAPLLAALIFCASPANAAIQTVGNVTNVTLSADPANGNTTATFAIDNGGAAALTPVAADVVRVRYHFGGLWSKEEPMIAKQPGFWATISNSVTFTDQVTNYLIQTPQLDVVVTKTPFKVDFKDKSGFYLLRDDHSEFDSAYGYSGQSGWTSGGFKLKCLKTLPAGQSFFGLGEYGGPLNRRGSEFECWNTGTYNWNEFNKPEYLNTPFFYGVQPASSPAPAFAYGIFFNNPCRPLFKFGTQFSGAMYSFEAGDGQLDYFFFGGGAAHTMAAVADRYSELTGRPAMLPKWAFGYHLSRFSYDNQSWVQYLADTAASSNIPLDAVYLDIDYMKVNAAGNPTDANNLHQFTMNASLFPNPASMVSYCGAKGVKIIPLIEPVLETLDPLYADANANNHFIKDNAANTWVGSIYLGPVSWPDFSSTPARTWWKNKISTWLTAVSFAGIWNDIDEPEGDSIPSNGLLWLDGRYGNSTTDTRRQWSNEHNYFGLRCASTSYEALLAKNPDKRPFVLSRSGNCGIQRYAVSWSGDTAANWTYARTCIRFGTSAMISGVAWFGHDIGGFTGTVDPELLTRCHEWGALLPFFRSHSRKGDDLWPGGNQGREPWRYPEPYQSDMRNCIQFRYKLMPYLYTLAYNCTQTGEPMNTPPVFKFYGDNNTASLNDYEFMVGDYLLAAPVYNQGDTNRSVYLPWSPGVSWYHWWSNTRYSGGQTVSVSAPLGKLPLFVRGGAIIPMGPTMQSTGQFVPNYLDLNCWPDGNSAFTLYEDEGEGWDYTNGVYAATTFTSSRTTTNWDFTIAARQGSYIPGHTNFYIYVYNPDIVSAVKLNGSTLAQSTNFNTVTTGWMMTGDGKLAIKVADAGAAQAVHVDWTVNTNLNSPYAAMSVAGTFLNPQWNPAASNMVLVADHTWELDTTLTKATNFQFKFAANGSWTTNWGENSGTQTQFTVPLSGNGKPGGSANILVNGTFNGTYRFMFNDQTLAYSVTPLLASPYASMTVAGNFNGWNTGLSNMLLVTNNIWQYDAVFGSMTNAQFKFAANDTWANSWGDNGQTQTNPPFSGSAQSFGSNIVASITTNGTYRFMFNDQTLAYSLQQLAIIVATNSFFIAGLTILSNGSFSFGFSNVAGASFSVLTTTNLSLPLSNWLSVSGVTEVASGQFQFTDADATNVPGRYYRVCSP